MAGETTISYGIGYIFDLKSPRLSAESKRALEELGDIESISYEAYFNGKQLRLFEPFHSELFAIVAKSSWRYGDPQENTFDWGVQAPLPPITEEEEVAFSVLFEEKLFSEMVISESQFVLSITSDF